METKTSFVWSDSSVELNTVTQVSLNITSIINPRYTEGKDSIRLNYSFNDFSLLKFRMLVVNFLYGF